MLLCVWYWHCWCYNYFYFCFIFIIHIFLKLIYSPFQLVKLLERCQRNYLPILSKFPLSLHCLLIFTSILFLSEHAILLNGWDAVPYFDLMSEHQWRDTYCLNSEIISTDTVRNAGFLLSDLSAWSDIAWKQPSIAQDCCLIHFLKWSI